MQSVPRVANPRRKSATLLQVCILLSAGSAAQGATYTAANTVNLNTGSVEMFAFGVGGGQQVGAGYVGSNSEQAFLWTNSSSSAVNLTPNGYITSIASAVGPGEQVGSVSTDSMGASPLAALWRNSAQTFVNLTPAQLGATSSIALATDGAQEGGFFDSAAGRHAVIWAGTAASAVDLHPTVAGSTFSVVNAVNGGLQGGEVSVNGFFHAFLWSGTAASARDLHPTNLPSATSSQINGVYGNEQVGYAKFNSVDTAIVWHGSADSAVSLQPAGYGFSQALATNGSQQVGYANVVSTTFTHAMIWSGTAASAVDLHSLIPGAVSSRATAIDVYGNVAGYARLGDQLDHPVTWLAGDTFVANAGTGAWNTAARWSGGIPAAGADVLILQNDAVPRYISYVSPTPSSIGNLTIDAGGFGSVGVIQGQDSLTAVNEFVGFVGTGYYNQSGGTHT
ncbi:MAG TPA: hypothetical protein VHM90_21545, partial [Phycisphaerae bacterium]|nr:hypothetical protein [Phycisphaerae bacterium]